MNYAIVEYFALPDDKDFVNDLSSSDVNDVLDAIRPEMTGVTEEHEKNLSSHSELPKEALNALNVVESNDPSEDANDPENKSGL